MDDEITSRLVMKPAINLPQDPSTVDYESEDERQYSDLQLRFNRVIDEGPYRTLSTYKKVKVLLLCWDTNGSDLATQCEVNDLKATFEELFNYHAEIKYLDPTTEQRLQVRMNRIMADFVDDHDGPNTLLIVYYAGHGRPGKAEFGDLELFGQTSPNDKKKRADVLVWNKTEALLMPAVGDVLEIFDCCYAGHVGLNTKGQRSFEYLGATDATGTTKVPGKDSFTRALIYALESLVKQRADGRFTTVELLNQIKTNAPDFPKDQNPKLLNREKENSAGRIVLHPLRKEGSDNNLSPTGAANLNPLKKHTLTLHFEFPGMPLPAYTETFGRELNDCFARNVGVIGVRWGGIKQSMVALAAKSFKEAGRRKRCASMRLQDPLTPYSSDQHSPRMTETVAKESPNFLVANHSAVSPTRLLKSDDESDHRVQEHRIRRKRRRT